MSFTKMLKDSLDSMSVGAFVFFSKTHIWQVFYSRFLMLH